MRGCNRGRNSNKVLLSFRMISDTRIECRNGYWTLNSSCVHCHDACDDHYVNGKRPLFSRGSKRILYSSSLRVQDMIWGFNRASQARPRPGERHLEKPPSKSARGPTFLAVFARGAAGETPAGQPAGRRRYRGERRSELRLYVRARRVGHPWGQRRRAGVPAPHNLRPTQCPPTQRLPHTMHPGVASQVRVTNVRCRSDAAKSIIL